MLPNQYWSTLQRQRQQKSQPQPQPQPQQQKSQPQQQQQQQQRSSQYVSSTTTNATAATVTTTTNPYRVTQPYGSQTYQYGVQQRAQPQYNYQPQQPQPHQIYQQQQFYQQQQQQHLYQQQLYQQQYLYYQQQQQQQQQYLYYQQQQQKMNQNMYGTTKPSTSQIYSSNAALGNTTNNIIPQKKTQNTPPPPPPPPQSTFDVFGSFDSVPPKTKQTEDSFNNFSSVTPKKVESQQQQQQQQQQKSKDLLTDDLFGSFSSVSASSSISSSSDVKNESQIDLFGDFSSVAPAKKSIVQETKIKKDNDDDDDSFGDFASVSPSQKSLPEEEKKKEEISEKKIDKKVSEQTVAQPIKETNKNVGGGSINWSDMTAVNNLISVFKEADNKEAEQQKKIASAQPLNQQVNISIQPQVIPQTNNTVQQPVQQQTMHSLTSSNTFATNINTNTNTNVEMKPQQSDDWGAFEALTPQKALETKKEEPPKVDDSWNAFENVAPTNNTNKSESLPSNTAKPLADDSLFDNVTPISVGTSLEPKKEEPPKVDDPWGDFEDANVESVSSQPTIEIKKEEPPKVDNTKDNKPPTSNTKFFTNDSLFEGVTPISIGITPESKKEEPLKSDETPKIDDPWGYFEDANVPPQPPEDSTKQEVKKEEPLKSGETPKIDDPWGDFEDANVESVSPQPTIEIKKEEPPKDDNTKNKEPSTFDTKFFTNDSLFEGVTPISSETPQEVKREETFKPEEQPKIDDPWGDFEDANVPPQLPEDSTKQEVKKEESIQSHETHNVDDPWGYVEDTEDKTLPPQLPDDVQKPKTEDKKEVSEEPPQIGDPWGDFEDASEETIPPQLPENTPEPKTEDKKKEELLGSEEPPQIEDPWGDFEDTPAKSLSGEKSEPTKKDTNSLIDWDMPATAIPVTISANYESSPAPSDDIFSLFTGIPNSSSSNNSAQINNNKDNTTGVVSVNLLDFTAPTTKTTITKPTHVDVSDIFGTTATQNSGSSSKKEGRSITIDKTLLASLIEQERFEEAILCHKDLSIQRKIHLKEKEMRSYGKSQTEINSFLSEMQKKLQPDSVINTWKLPSLTHETLEEIRSANRMCKKTKEEISSIHKELMRLSQTSLSEALALYNKTLEELSAIAENPWELALKSASKEFGRAISIFTSIATAPHKVSKAAVEHHKIKDYIEGLKMIRSKTLEIEKYAKSNMLSLYLPEQCRLVWNSLCDVVLMCGIRINLNYSECDTIKSDNNFGMCFVCMSQITDSNDAKEQCHKICNRLIK